MDQRSRTFGAKVISLNDAKRRRGQNRFLQRSRDILIPLVAFVLVICAVYVVVDRIDVPSVTAFLSERNDVRSATTSQRERIDAPSAAAFQRASFQICASSKRYTCIVDGDTLWLKGEKFRLRGINAPEKHSPKCRREADLAKKATVRLREILNTNAWTVKRFGFDRYGRTLAEFRIGRDTAGDILVREGLAHRWEGFKLDWGC